MVLRMAADPHLVAVPTGENFPKASNCVANRLSLDIKEFDSETLHKAKKRRTTSDVHDKLSCISPVSVQPLAAAGGNSSGAAAVGQPLVGTSAAASGEFFLQACSASIQDLSENFELGRTAGTDKFEEMAVGSASLNQTTCISALNIDNPPPQHSGRVVAATNDPRFSSHCGVTGQPQRMLHFLVASALKLPKLPCKLYLPLSATVKDLKLKITEATDQQVKPYEQELFVKAGQGYDLVALIDLGHSLEEVFEQFHLPRNETCAVLVTLRDFKYYSQLTKALETAIQDGKAQTASAEQPAHRLLSTDGAPVADAEVHEYARVLAELHGAKRRAPGSSEHQQTSSGCPSPTNSNTGTHSRKAAADLRKRRDTTGKRWTTEETASLVEGVEQFGSGNWQVILDTFPDAFNKCRNAIDLKDKWRNLVKIVENPRMVCRSVKLDPKLKERIQGCRLAEAKMN